MLRPVMRNINRPVMRDMFAGLSGVDLSLYSFYPDKNWKDQISGQDIIVDLAAGRFNDVSGLEIGLNVKNTDPDGTLNIGPGAYEQLGFASENTSLWSGSGPWTITINVTDIETHTLSTSLDGATVSIAAGTATIDGTASATYGNDDQFEVTGAGTIIVTTDTADPKYQVTASTYRLPYAPNDSAVSTLLVPANNSGAASGYSYAIEGDLLDSLDGVADGANVYNTTDYTLFGGQISYDSETEIYHINSDGTATGVRDVDALATNTYYESYVEIIEITTGSLRVTTGDVQTVLSSLGVHPVRENSGSTQLSVFSRQSGVTDLKFKVHHVKQISDAKGELVATIIPQFNAGDIEAVVNIFTANDEATSFFLYDDVNELLTAFDGTNTATVAFSPVAGTEYEIRLMYGENTGSKMRVAVDAVYGTEATFSGTFPNNTHLKLGYGAEWFKMETEPQWFKEVQSSW